jgi:hypothetical protein
MPTQKIQDHVSDGWYTEVSWRRKPGLDPDDQGTASGHVQLATVNALSPFHFPDIDTGDHFEAGEKFDGWRITLDEDGIDRLIKTLHKAKRQAFGEPERNSVTVNITPSTGVTPQQVADAVSAYCSRHPWGGA